MTDQHPPPSHFARQAVKDLVEDLLEPDPEARLGCRTSAFEEFQNHGFFSDFNFVALEDGSLTSPFNDRCQTEVTHFYKTTLSKLSFDAPPYVGDNRWCDDWDYTCTVGATVESSSAGDTQAVTQRRKSQAPPMPTQPTA